MASQVNYYYYYDGDDNEYIIPQNLYGNGLEDVANRKDVGLNTKKLHEIIYHIENGNHIPSDSTIEKNIMPGLQRKSLQLLYSTLQEIGIT